VVKSHRCTACATAKWCTIFRFMFMSGKRSRHFLFLLYTAIITVATRKEVECKEVKTEKESQGFHSPNIRK
jgi:hypothetical protein